MAGKSKGKTAERHYARVFRELGFDRCVTSRYGSKMIDDAGIDLMNMPINIQIKAGQQRNLNIPLTLKDIKGRAAKIGMDNILAIIHRRDVKQGVPRTEFDEIVSLTFEDFSKLLLGYDKNKRQDK